MQIFVDLCGQQTVSARIEDPTSTTFGDLRSSIAKISPALTSSYLSYRGKVLPESDLVSSHSISSYGTIQVRVRVRGGGGDGGATGAESRDCYLNMYAVKKPDKVDPNEARIAKWTRCSISSEPLRPPFVADFLGNLYNKEALVSGLLAKSLPKEIKHIKGLKDMVTLLIDPIPGATEDDETRFQCPISGLEFNGKYKFFALRGCGHVLSARALKELQSSSCLVCAKPFVENDKIVINGNEEEVLALRQRMEEEEAIKHRGKKERKEKKGKLDEKVTIKSSEEELGVAEEGMETMQKNVKPSETEGMADDENVNTGLGHDKTRVKRKGSKAEVSHNTAPQPSSKKFKALDVMPPNATKEVYASIFSSSSKSKIKETYMCRALPIGRN